MQTGIVVQVYSCTMQIHTDIGFDMREFICTTSLHSIDFEYKVNGDISAGGHKRTSSVF